MIILGIDSSVKISSVAVAKYNGTLKILANAKSDGILPHSENLLPMIDSALKACGLGIGNVDIFAVTNGPGSFTGIRIGVATLKGLAFERGVCCAGISTLDALAEMGIRTPFGSEFAPVKYIIAPLIDARRNQAYNALYLYDNETLKKIVPDRIILIPDLLNELNSPAFASIPVYFCGDVKEDSVLDAEGRYKFLPFGNIAEAACGHLYGGGVAVESTLTDPNNLVPRYLIKTQAEREYMERGI